MSAQDQPRPETGDIDVLDAVNRAIAALEAHPDPAVRQATQELLAGIDAVHRSGLTHLAQGIHTMAGEAFLNRLVGDPAIRLLLMSYNLIAVDRRIQAEEAIDAVRGHLHSHGIDVEIPEVVGGVVYVRLHQSHRADAGVALSNEAVRHDLEAALRQGFLGFQELVVGDRNARSTTVTTISLSTLRRAHRPVYVDAGAADLVPGTVRAVTVRAVPVLLASVDGEVYAVRNQCGDSPLPLEFSALTGAELHCSWHGCRYDVRSGRRLDGGEADRLQVFPVLVTEGRIQLAVDVEPALKSQ